ncbi:MAG: excinuclease ABC subunit C [Salinisphaeraceae bacterium]|nr:excinuclease ABC subunit C [Salinisphaeraceae bacterium]
MSDTAFDPKAYVQQLTARPGVYRMYDAGGDVLYVGKAKNLKKRVSSYFMRASGNAKTEAMLDQVAHIEVSITHTEDEALLLESTLIKKHRPRYNICLRDDKSFPYLYLSTAQDFPRVAYHRGAQKRPGRYFGPYPSAGAVRQTQDTIHKLFRLRNCSDTFFENRSRPCLQHQIKRCTAPCVGKISKQDYAADVADAVDLLEGRNEKLVSRLSDQMGQAAEKLDFESAAVLREKIAAVRRLQEQSQTIGKSGDFDIVCAGIQAGEAAVVVVTIRGGTNLGHRSYSPRLPANADESELVSAFLGQFYLERKAPPEILVHPEPNDQGWLQEALAAGAGRQVALKTRVRGRRADWLANARATLRQTLEATLVSRAGAETRLTSLKDALGLPAPPMRMECFDISHTGGERTVASCVVFEAGSPNKSAYRRFNITGVPAGDDYGALRQALTRRYQRVLDGEHPMPDLLIIDGGRGQLSAVGEALEEIGAQPPCVMSVAKGLSRKAGREQLFLPAVSQPLILPPDSPALHLVQHIRDEAHRFAIAGHRGQRQKARKSSALDEIEGLGPVRKKRLLQAFGGTRQISRAGVRDLTRIEGISKSMASRIYAHFHEGE